MKTYEKCLAIRNTIIISAAEVMNYTNWSSKFAAKEIRQIPKILEKEIGQVNITELTEAQMDDLGFGRYSKDSSMRLIPLWLFKFLPDEFECENINGTKSMFKTKEMNNDHRFGFLAYGILPNKATNI